MSLKVKASTEAKHCHHVKCDKDILELNDLDPCGLEDWVEDNIKANADIKKVLKVLLKKAFITDMTQRIL
jgi:hypothetical protein